MNDHDIILGRFARNLIRRKARLLSTFPEFQDQLVEDLEQELFVFLTAGMDLFDPVIRHPNVFTTTVIERAVARLLRNQRAKKAGTSRVFPLSTLTLEEQTRYEPPGRSDQRPDLAIDLAAAIRDLPPKLRRLARLLARELSAKEIADRLHVSKDTVRRWVTTIRTQFESTGLRDYL